MPELVKQLKPLALSELNPPLNVTLVTNVVEMQKVFEYLKRKAEKK